MGRPKASKITGKFYLRTDRKADSNGKYVVYLDYAIGSKHARTATEVWIEERFWDAEKRQVNAKHPQHKRLNGQLEKKRRDIDEAIYEYSLRGRLNISILRSLVQGKTVQGKSKEDDFFTYATSVIDDLYQREKNGIAVRNNSLCSLNLFRKYLMSVNGEDTLYIGELNEELVKEYIRWRQSNGNTNATINKAITPLIKAAKQAAKDKLLDGAVAASLTDLYLPIKPKVGDDLEDTTVNYLTPNQVKTFIALYDEVKYPRTRDYMDMFLFSLAACGLRISDLIFLEWRNVDLESRTLRKIIYKTNKPHLIPLNNDAMKILEKWHDRTGDKRFVFGLVDDDCDLNDKEEANRLRLNKNRAVTTSLHTIGHKMGLNFNLTMHIARHTFAVWALNRGVDIHKISTLLAHSSISVTETVYARFLPNTLEKEVQEKLNFNLMD